jgi:hypothetical protein
MKIKVKHLKLSQMSYIIICNTSKPLSTSQAQKLRDFSSTMTATLSAISRVADETQNSLIVTADRSSNMAELT